MKEEKNMFGTGKRVRQIQDQLNRLEEELEASGVISVKSDRRIPEELTQLSAAIEELTGSVTELRDAANSHDIAIGDLLDGWEDLQEEQRGKEEALREALYVKTERELRQTKGREEALLKLTMEMHDLLFGLRRTAEASVAGEWQHQLDLVDEKLNESRLPAGFYPVCEAGVPINFTEHEVLDIVRTTESDKDRKIADVYSCGYLYRGKVLKKAKVSVFRYEEPHMKEAETTNCGETSEAQKH